MRPKAAMLFAFLAVSWSTLLLATPPPLPAPSVPCCGAVEDGKVKKDKGKGGKNTAGNGYWVCPIYCYAHWGEFCSYYSKVCPEPMPPEYLNLDAECFLPSVWMCKQDDPCVQFGGGPQPAKGKKAAAKKGMPPHASKGLKKGLMKKPSHDFKVTLPFPLCKKTEEGLFAFEYQKGMECTIRLFKMELPAITIGLTVLPARAFYHAIEVEPPFPVVHVGKISRGDIDVVEPGRKVCTFDRNGNSYQCIVHNSRTIMK